MTAERTGWPYARPVAADDALRVHRGLVIPLAEIDWRATAPGGPGGQHANRTLSRVEVSFDVENSAALGEYFLERLKTIRSRWIKEIRGKGLWIGVELVPAAGGARRFCEALRDKGMLCKETHVHTIRFAPPLNVTREELDWALERIVAVFAALD